MTPSVPIRIPWCVIVDNVEYIGKGKDDDQYHGAERLDIGDCVSDQVYIVCCSFVETHPIEHLQPQNEHSEASNDTSNFDTNDLNLGSHLVCQKAKVSTKYGLRSNINAVPVITPIVRKGAHLLNLNPSEIHPECSN